MSLSSTAMERKDREQADRPIIAYFSPLPPQQSGISDYSISLLGRLCDHYAIDVYHDDGYIPDLGPVAHEVCCLSHRLFERRVRVLQYRAIMYQMGNSHFHRYVFDRLLSFPGLVTLHDFYLGGFHHGYARQPGVPPEYLDKEVAYECGLDPQGLTEGAFDPGQDPDRLEARFRERGLWLNRRVLDSATQVIVHSEWCRQQAMKIFAPYRDKLVTIPLGADISGVARADMGLLRQKFGLPPEALVVGCFGIMHPKKLNAETVEAFAGLGQKLPAALLMFVGQDFGQGEVQSRVAELGLNNRVKFFGHRSIDDFRDLINVTDIAINLRRPPTNGESSAALLQLLGAGIPTLITDVDTFALLPDNVVVKISYGQNFVEDLTHQLIDLAFDERRRVSLARAAMQYICTSHTWDAVAKEYKGLIDGLGNGQKSISVRKIA